MANHSHPSVSPADLEQSLRAIVGDDAVRADPIARELYSTDLLERGALCELVVSPSCISELEKAVALITGKGFSIAPRGGGLTYVRGYTPAQQGTVTLDLARMNRILEINEEDMYILVEAGVTWSQIYNALKPRGLRLPFFGTFSGKGATVGGGLSNGALFFGTARYGTASEIVLGMTVVQADGRLLNTGQLAAERAEKPFFRNFGPDLTGLFTHDSGALGIKAHASLRIIRDPAHADYLSFGFADRNQAIAALSEVGRSELAEEAFVMDPEKTRLALSAPSSLIRDVRTLGRVMKQEKGIWRKIRAGGQLAMGGRRFADTHCYSLHMTLGGRSRQAVDADRAAARKLMQSLGGAELPNSIPKAGRAEIFSTLDTVVGPKGERFVAINAKVPHSEARALIDAAEAIIAQYQARTQEMALNISRLLTVISNHAFSFEVVFTWQDAWLPLHHATLGPRASSALQEGPNRPDARALVMEMRQALIDLFAQMGAASSQIGRSYPYVDILREEPRALLQGIKEMLDPHCLINPGALGLHGPRSPS